MAIVECKNGHFYNNSEFSNCPYCSGVDSVGQTIPLDSNGTGSGSGYGNGPGATMDLSAAGGFGKTESLDHLSGTIGYGTDDLAKTVDVNNAKYGHTMILDDKKNSEISPVRGWLVIIDGAKIGMDYKIHVGRNYIGRAKSSDICIDFDQKISMEKSGVIIYDERKNVFYIQEGESKNNIYLNDEILLGSHTLVDNDIVEIGETKFIFRALCNDAFSY